MAFEKIITDEIEAYVKNIPWRTLGVDLPGQTECLVFDCNITKDRNAYMFEQYKKAYVKQHSVGMRYVDLSLAINDEDFKEEFAEWNKHIHKIANANEVEANGYFFAIKQAKVIEGSAVPLGSNPITPVLDNNLKHTTSFQPPVSTDEGQPFNLDVAIKQTKIFN